MQSKSERHDIIMEIIRGARLETQSDLVAALRLRGVDCTQATVSRDVKELKLTKVQSEGGAYYYAGHDAASSPVVGKLLEALSNGYQSSDYSGNIVVMKTVSGTAPACALAIDAIMWPGVLGTLAGEDTVMIVTKSAAVSKKFLKKLEDLLQ